ncbi:MAG: hypothetical protein QF535_23865, partial [Anaerolineales bacterium]|nr:hypothetical protein [Anaerolineales bacterium]
NVGDISLDSISSDAGTSINVVLGSDAGDDFTVDTSKLVVEGDTGNVGIGKVPEYYYDNFRVLEIGSGGTGTFSLQGRIGDYSTMINRNAYFDKTNIRDEMIATGYAQSITFNDATSFSFKNSGTSSTAADAAISWDTLMVLERDGNVGIGTNAPDSPLMVENDQSRTSQTGTTFGLVHLDGGQASDDLTTITLAESSGKPVTIIGAKTDTGAGSSLFFGTSNNYNNGITQTGMTINPSGNVGIGTASPDAKLAVITADIGQTPSTSADELVVENTGYCGISIFSGATSSGNIFFGDSGDAAAGAISFDQNSQYFDFGISGSKMRILSSGNVGIGTTSPDNKLEIEVNDSDADGITQVLKLTHDTTGTAANGIGAGILFATENYQGQLGYPVARISGYSVDQANYGGGLKFDVYTTGGNNATALTITNDKNATFAGDVTINGGDMTLKSPASANATFVIDTTDTNNATSDAVIQFKEGGSDRAKIYFDGSAAHDLVFEVLSDTMLILDAENDTVDFPTGNATFAGT